MAASLSHLRRFDTHALAILFGASQSTFRIARGPSQSSSEATTEDTECTESHVAGAAKNLLHGKARCIATTPAVPDREVHRRACAGIQVASSGGTEGRATGVCARAEGARESGNVNKRVAYLSQDRDTEDREQGHINEFIPPRTQAGERGSRGRLDTNEQPEPPSDA